MLLGWGLERRSGFLNLTVLLPPDLLEHGLRLVGMLLLLLGLLLVQLGGVVKSSRCESLGDSVGIMWL